MVLYRNIVMRFWKGQKILKMSNIPKTTIIKKITLRFSLVNIFFYSNHFMTHFPVDRQLAALFTLFKNDGLYFEFNQTECC